jgi:hypothetical protein
MDRVDKVRVGWGLPHQKEKGQKALDNNFYRKLGDNREE